MFDSVLYKFRVLPNGYTKGPRKFTKLLKPMLATLRKLGSTLAAYLDDIINFGGTYNKCWDSFQRLMNMLQSLGFVIHPNKSIFTPTTRIEFLGCIIESITMTVELTVGKKEKIHHLCISWSNAPNPS